MVCNSSSALLRTGILFLKQTLRRTLGGTYRSIKPCKGAMVGGSELELNGLRLDVSQEYSAREGKSEGLS